MLVVALRLVVYDCKHNMIPLCAHLVRIDNSFTESVIDGSTYQKVGGFISLLCFSSSL